MMDLKLVCVCVCVLCALNCNAFVQIAFCSVFRCQEAGGYRKKDVCVAVCMCVTFCPDICVWMCWTVIREREDVFWRMWQSSAGKYSDVSNRNNKTRLL